MSYMIVDCPWCDKTYDFGIVGTTMIGSGHTCAAVITCATPGCEKQGNFLVYEHSHSDDPVFSCQEHIDSRVIAGCQPGVE